MANAPCRPAREDDASPENLRANVKPNRPDPNAELQQRFEPLRIGFALFALLLGALASLQF